MVAAPTRARQARSIETRARLLAAARAVIAEAGIEGAAVDAIAERAGRTSGSLYGQFGSKAGLVVALLDESLDVVAERMLVDIEAATDLDGRLAALWRNFVTPPRTARDWLRVEHEVWLWATRPGNDEVRVRLAERYRVRFAALGEALADWAAEGIIDPPAAVDRLAALTVSTLLGLEMAARLDPRAVDEATVVAALGTLLGRT